MKTPARVTARFATPLEVADRLGVPRRRALELIKLADSIHAANTSNGAVRPKKKTNLLKKNLLKKKVSKRQPRAKASKPAG